MWKRGKEKFHSIAIENRISLREASLKKREEEIFFFIVANNGPNMWIIVRFRVSVFFLFRLSQPAIIHWMTHRIDWGKVVNEWTNTQTQDISFASTNACRSCVYARERATTVFEPIYIRFAGFPHIEWTKRRQTEIDTEIITDLDNIHRLADYFDCFFMFPLDTFLVFSFMSIEMTLDTFSRIWFFLQSPFNPNCVALCMCASEREENRLESMDTHLFLLANLANQSQTNHIE